MRRTVRSIRSFFRVPSRSQDGDNGFGGEMSQEKFEDRFRLGTTLGKGNFSVVREAEDLVTGEIVAVKCIRKKHLSAEDREGLKAEVRILSGMDHPNIIKLYGMHEDNAYYYVVTELVKGGELFDRIVAKEFYQEKDAAQVVKTIAEALKYCNEHGIVHRDLKPENILMEDDENDHRLKLADFGFAKELDTSSEEAMLRTTCGTPGYVAPEIIKGAPYGREVDMWSLGVITYILLCGYPPFYDENQAHLFRLIKKAKYKFDPEFWSEVSDSAKDLIRGLLQVDPTQRFTPDDVLAHPWIVHGGADQDITPALNQLKSYQNRRRLKKGILTVMAANRIRKLVSFDEKDGEAEAEDDSDDSK
ncbi:Protein kinase, putative [Hondaea fermentalgiana]|uniref:non-specific serine/threonine protein kinase n=1 Tax=Hondaea fermentalgiana TaxID=2315210 RepID=A0A2R5GSI8_9STRA|nr:Protein kinase, putative [Hondaea fermentalgiana]|eukprot:GBG33832.1 Protein kinase, putative [Hondaea fermentalgiana]